MHDLPLPFPTSPILAPKPQPSTGPVPNWDPTAPPHQPSRRAHLPAFTRPLPPARVGPRPRSASSPKPGTTNAASLSPSPSTPRTTTRNRRGCSTGSRTSKRCGSQGASGHRVWQPGSQSQSGPREGGGDGDGSHDPRRLRGEVEAREGEQSGGWGRVGAGDRWAGGEEGWGGKGELGLVPENVAVRTGEDGIAEEDGPQPLEGPKQHEISPDEDRPKPPLVRIHSECYTGETAWSARCDCGEQLDEAARLMSLHGGGVIVYLRQEGRGIGLSEKLKAYNLQDLGSDTVEANLLLRHPADARSYGLATAILLDLGCGGDQGIRLLTNNPHKVRAVEGPNREVIVRERVAMIPLAWKHGGKRGIHSKEIEQYLSTKIGKMGHMIND
ncbi:hypothetical protein GJ744_003521 [Endocarpon pusillum]|uniref:GTP cyclohydrolase II n=1 Tax=Endocarpon pusillum TaxID=364733 RepID=A0A8H7AVB3_9EURO|nr:hypothetical protein GJ744_003521 [Endocarpon pusillum]